MPYSQRPLFAVAVVLLAACTAKTSQPPEMAAPVVRLPIDGWIDATRHPLAAKSVLNYGVKDVAGDFAAKDRAQLIRKSIAGAIENFEPRIRKGSARVEIRTQNISRDTIISFDIRADMWAEPIPIELYLRSSVDVTTGQVSLERAG